MKPKYNDMPHFKSRIYYTLRKYAINRKYALQVHLFGGYTLIHKGRELSTKTSGLIGQIELVRKLKIMLKTNTEQLTIF